MTDSVICPYCHCPTMLTDRSRVFGSGQYGRIYYCLICGAYVGCHPGGKKPLGTPADRVTRWMRTRAHDAFDPIWKYGRMSRTDAYLWLAVRMGLPTGKAHIGMFTAEQCARVIQLCKGGK